jgi:hypothetical protein
MIKLQWREEGGSAKEQVRRDDFVIYGVNEVERVRQMSLPPARTRA